jgi:ribosome recycling factor
VRRDGMDRLKKAKVNGLSEDDLKIWSDEVQTLTDAAISTIDVALERKQTEIMQV